MELKDLEFTREEILDRLASKVGERIFGYNHDGDEELASLEDRLRRKLNGEMSAMIDASVARIAASILQQPLENLIRNWTITETNRWGEQKGATLTFVEYIVSRVEAFLVADVDLLGRAQNELSEYESRNFRSAGKRIPVLVAKHLNSHIEKATTELMKSAMVQVHGGLESALKASLQLVLDKMKLETKITETR